MGSNLPRYHRSALFLVGWAAALTGACGLGTGGARSDPTRGPHDGGPSADDATGGTALDDGPPDSLAPDDSPRVSDDSGGGSGSGGGRGDGSSGSATTDAASDSTPPAEGAAPLGDGGPTPGSVACAGTACSLSGSICCICPGCFPPFPTSCFPSFPGCVTGVPLHCDDASDCSSGEVCCGSYTGATFTGSTCKTSCASGDVQLCNVSRECLHGTCDASSSLSGLSACM